MGDFLAAVQRAKEVLLCMWPGCIAYRFFQIAARLKATAEKKRCADEEEEAEADGAALFVFLTRAAKRQRDGSPRAGENTDRCKPLVSVYQAVTAQFLRRKLAPVGRVHRAEHSHWAP